MIAPCERFVYLTPSLDAAHWSAALAPGAGAPRVYTVAATGPLEDTAALPDHPRPPHPSMTWRTPAPLTVLTEITAWTHYHGTRADLRVGDLISPGHESNYGASPRAASFVYFARTLDAATWGAELAAGDAAERIYVVEPTGAYEDDPNLTDAKFRGNPTGSFRSRAPLRILRELTGWTGHPPEVIQAMKAGLARLQQQGIEPDDG